MTFDDAFRRLPLVAILRGLAPEEAGPVVDAVVDAGFTLVEVPLNSPRPFETIAALVPRHAGRALIGAGTVLSATEVATLAATGASLCVSPNTHPEVIAAAVAAGLVPMPGAATPTEAFQAIAAGAAVVKLFPAETLPPVAVKAWRAVLPRDVKLVPVGGIAPETMAPYRAAGADGFGIGSALYKPGMGAEEVGERARAFVSAWRSVGDA